MQFKRFTAALCAASIALTQTAIVPISVSADNTAPYDEPTATQSFTDQYSFILGAGSTSVSADASAKSVTLDGSAVTDTSSELSFFYGGSINSDFAFQDGDIFNFSVEGLTVTASKDRTTTVAEQTIPLGTYGQTYTSQENIIFDKDQCSKAIENSQIIVSFSEIPGESDTSIPASIDIQDANGNTICTGVTNASGDETYFDLTADTAASIRENGFTLVVNDLTLNSVLLSIPAHDEQEHSETSAEIGSSSWSITAENGVLSTADQIVNLTDSIFTDLSDFSENGSVTAAWTSFTCSLERNETEEDGGITINEKNFPDEKFRNYVSDKFDTNKSGLLSDNEIAAAKTIDIRSSGIRNLTGIEYFTEAESLYLDYINPSVCDISKNIKLKELTLTYSKINYIDITKNTQLETIDAHMCNLSRLDTSKCTKLKSLNVGGSKIIALDLSNCSELTEFYPGEPHIFISVQNDRFDLSTLSEYGLDVSKIISVSNAKLNGSILTFSADTSSASYTYDTGIDGKPLNVTLYINERTYSGFIISYEADGTENTVPCETWNDVLKTINNNSIDYTITLQSDVDVSSLKFPSAAKSITLISDGDAKTITTNSSSVSIPTNVTLKNISIESTAKTFTITAGKNLTIDEFTSKSLTNLNGGAKSTLEITLKDAIDYNISGFGTIAVSDSSVFEFKGTIKATNLQLEGVIRVGKASVTFTNIICSDGAIDYTEAGFTPITVTGNITLAENSDKLYFSLYTDDALSQFSTSDTILVAKAANLSNIEIDPDCLPDDGKSYTLTRVGSDIKIMAEAFELSCNGSKVGTFTQWSDVIAAINDPTANYAVKVLTDTDLGGTFTMPKAGTFGSLDIKSDNSDLKTLSFTGNVVLTGRTSFSYIKLESYKTVENVRQPANFTITANYDLDIFGKFISETLSEIKGSTKSDLTMFLYGSADYDITGFNTTTVPASSNIEFNGKVNTATLNIFSSVKVGQGKITAANIIYNSSATVKYSDANFTPITVTGSITDEAGSKLKIALCYSNDETDEQYQRFSAGDTILVAKTADLSNLEIYPDCLPDDENSYTLARVGSDIKIMTEAFKLSCNGSEVGSYAEWSDVIAAINNPTANYAVEVLADTDLGGTFTMPKAGTFKSLSITNGTFQTRTLSFTGNVVLTGETRFNDIKLESYKKVGNACQPANFTITADYDIAIEGDFYSDTLTAIKGSAKSTLKLYNANIHCDIIGFNTIDVDSYAWLRGTVKATNLDLSSNDRTYSNINVGQNSVTVANIIHGDEAFIRYTDKNFTPITVTESIINKTDSKLSIVLSNGSLQSQKFSAGDTVLISKTADLSQLEVYSKSLPDDENSYTLGRVGSDVKIMKEALEVTYNEQTEVFAQWSDVLDLIDANAKAGNKDYSYNITLISDYDVDGEFKMPAANTYKSLSFKTKNDATTIRFTGNIVLTGKTNFSNIKFESYKKVGNDPQPANFTITANYDLEIGGDFDCETLTAINGSAKSTLKLYNANIHCDIIGFNTIDVDTYANLKGTVKATNLDLSGNDGTDTVNVGQNSVTFANIIYGNGSFIRYTDKNFTPITVTGSITDEAGSKLKIALCYSNDDTDEQYQRFSAGDTILVAKTADLSQLEINSDCLPDDGNSYTLARVGSDIKIMTEAFVVEYNEQTEVFAQWSDVLDLISANAKAGNKGYSYKITLVSDYDMNGTFKMPAANTYKSLSFKSANEAKTIRFTGNITLTGATAFNNVNFVSQKKVNNVMQSVEFSITAGKNPLYLFNSDSKIKSITSSGIVYLDDVTVGTINANNVAVAPPDNTSSNSIDSLASLNSLADLDSFAEFAANAEEWTGKDAPETSVNITGNLTAKDRILLANSKLYVGGIINAYGIASSESTIVVNKQAKGKYPLVIGKKGISNIPRISNKSLINFVLLDPETGKTAKITDETILGTITGPYADQLIPSNDNLEADDSYYIIKSGNKLIAKPKDTAGLVEVVINSNTAYYKNLDEAIKDINATGKASDYIEIRLTQDMFKSPIAKLPLPNAGKYDRLVYFANSDVTIDLTGDLTLTGELMITQNVHINKVKVTGKGENAKTEVVPISVNVGKYDFHSQSAISASEDEPYVSRIANISGTGIIYLFNYTVITGKVTNAMIVSSRYNLKLEGASASFSGSFAGLSAKFIYDKSIAKNVKFKDLDSHGNVVLVITDGDGTATFAENSVIASITGDYIGEVTVEGCSYKIVRSGNDLKAVAEDNVVKAETFTFDEQGGYDLTRFYDSFASAMTDISRIKDSTAKYTITVRDNDTFVLPAANTYGKLKLTAKNNVKTVLTTSKDLTLTGELEIDENVFINKTNGSAMSINLGNYVLDIYENAGIAYDFEKNVSRFTSISGKGGFTYDGSCTVSGKVNVGTYSVAGTTLGDKASFSAAEINVVDNDKLSYPISVAKNVKFGVINIVTKTGGNDTDDEDNIVALSLDIDGVKSGDQVAVLTGDYLVNTIKLADKDDFILARSGNKLVAVDFDSENDKSINCVCVLEKTSNKACWYDSYANAIADINRLNDPNGEYLICFIKEKLEFSKLALPTKGRYKSVTLAHFTEDVEIEISVKSDIALTGDFGIDGYLTLKKSNGSTLKFTSPKNKDGSPLYNVTVGSDAKIVNGTLNGKEIADPKNDSQTTGNTAA